MQKEFFTRIREGREEEKSGIFKKSVPFSAWYERLATWIKLHSVRNEADMGTQLKLTLRWWRLFPQRRDKNGSPSEPTELDLNMIRNDAAGLAEKRRRLSDVSWFMRCLAEPIARFANKEDKVTGRFWEGRFRAQPLLDETAIAACMVYVDLNPVRAGVAATPETRNFTSVKERIEDRQAAESQATADTRDNPTEHGPKAGWLASIPLKPTAKKCDEKPHSRRASQKGCLPMSLEDYLSLVEWTGRAYRKDKVGKIPEQCQPLFQRLHCDGQTWLDWVKNFRQRFRNEVGRPAARQAFKADRTA